MTLEQALAYLTPHPHTNGPVQLTPSKMREAIGVIRAALPPPGAPRYDETAHYERAIRRLQELIKAGRYELSTVGHEHIRCRAWVGDLAQSFTAVEKRPTDAVETVIRKIEKSRAA